MNKDVLVDVDLDIETKPILNSSEVLDTCRRCNKQFYRKKNTSLTSLSYYRCEKCLENNVCLFDLLYFCNIQ